MKLGRKHLIASLAVLGASVVWNVWVFSQASPARPGSGRVSEDPPLIDSAPGPSAGGAPAVDPMTIPAPPPVDLTKPPAWPRNPFAQRAVEAAPSAPLPSDAPAPPALPVVGVILYSAQGRHSAIIDGRTVSVGDRVQGGVVVSIARDAVTVQLTSGERVRLALRSDGGSS